MIRANRIQLFARPYSLKSIVATLTRGLILFEHALTSILTDMYMVNVCKTKYSAIRFFTLHFYLTVDVICKRDD